MRNITSVFPNTTDVTTANDGVFNETGLQVTVSIGDTTDIVKLSATLIFSSPATEREFYFAYQVDSGADVPFYNGRAWGELTGGGPSIGLTLSHTLNIYIPDLAVGDRTIKLKVRGGMTINMSPTTYGRTYLQAKVMTRG